MAATMMGPISVEEFSSWFKCQEASTRLDIVNAILQMLHPLELRFVASCVEDLTRKDYNIFRESELRYNGGENFAVDFFDLTRPFCRGKLLVALSLLYSNNYVNSCVLFKTLMSLYSLLEKLPMTKEIVDEVMLLFSMAKYHPAFGFDQRATMADLTAIIVRFIQQHTQQCCSGSGAQSTDSQTPPSGEIYQVPASTSRTEENSYGGKHASIVSDQQKCEINAKVFVDSGSQTDDVSIFLTPEPTPLPCIAEECESGSNDKDDGPCSSSFGDCVSASPPEYSADSVPVTVSDVEVIGVKKTTGGRSYTCDVKVLWSNGEETVTEKNCKDWHKFHQQLINFYPLEAGLVISERMLPYFPGFPGGMHKEPEAALLTHLNTFLQQLKLLPLVFLSDFMANFLKSGSSSLMVPSDERANSRTSQFTDFGSLTISPVSDEVFSRFTERCSQEEQGNDLQSQLGHSFHDDDGRDTVDTSIDPGGNDELPATSSASYPGSQSGSFVLYSRGSGQQFWSPPPIRNNYDGFHQSLTTALLIVRPNSTSPSLEKMLQTNLLVSRENSSKILSLNNGIDEVEPSSNSTGAFFSK